MTNNQQADAERIDFLARAGDVYITMIQDAPGDGLIRVSHDSGPDGIGETLRAAIDQAMHQQKGEL